MNKDQWTAQKPISKMAADRQLCAHWAVSGPLSFCYLGSHLSLANWLAGATTGEPELETVTVHTRTLLASRKQGC